ncbi:DNA ligase 3 [Termitomyces sp. J132]|nr:DNA ligase 3 [Termitomyces sp. J132]
MSKRLDPDESSGNFKKKRTRLAKDQQSLHHFFSSSRTSQQVVSPVKASASSDRSTSSPHSTGKSFQKSHVIDVDALDNDGAQTFSVNSSIPVSGPKPPSGSSTDDKSAKAALSVANKPLVYGDLTCDPATRTFIEKPWPSSSVPYSFLAHALSALSQTRSRKIITNILTNCLYCIIRYDPQSLLSAIYLLSNTLAPPYTSLELGLGPSIILRSIQNVSGLTTQALRRLYHATGDPGDVAFAAKSSLRTLLPHPPLLVNYVYASLLKISRCKGQGTVKEKGRIVEKLLLAATGEEIRFLTRTLSQNLRVGAVRTTILSALSRAMVLIPSTHFTNNTSESSLHHTAELLENCELHTIVGKRKAVDRLDDLAVRFGLAESLVKRVYVQHPNYEDIVTALLQAGLDSLEERVHLTIGIPLHPTLGSPTRSLEEVYDVCQDRPFVAEFKYDGQRAQIHGSTEEGNISVFSRHLEDMTSKYPDVVQYVKTFFSDHPETTSFILDTEIVSIDPTGGLRSFQELSNRARKDVQLQDVQVFVSIFAFDLMYLNGEILLKRTFRERRDLLISRFPPFISRDKQLARFNHVESCTSTEGRDAIKAFLVKAIQSRCEGLMIKAAKSRRKPLPATYEPDKRTSAWLKLKKDYVTGFGDTLDLIPIGAWHGNGRKAQWWSPILLGLWQPERGRIVAVCKCMSGSTPEVYFKPTEVWEIRGADITLSPISVAAKGLVSASRGLSIRFPRFIKVREDKSIEQASTPIFLAKLWRNQEAKGVKQDFDDEVLVDIEPYLQSNSESEPEI